jgi:predicted nucleotidyltransferase
MNREEFKHKRIKGRTQLLEIITINFKSFNPVAIHQFGSGPNGYKDEFSDIDIWITFKDDDIGSILNQLSNIFESIAPVLVRHYSKSWSPVGGSANSIIFDTKYGLFVVDLYISKLSETVIKTDSQILFGDDSLKRGEWKLNRTVNKDMHDSHSLKKDIDLLLDLEFISVKGIVRKWENDDFINILKSVYRDFRKRNNLKLKRRHISLSYKSLHRILNDIYPLANKKQKLGIYKIRKYTKQVEILYT